MTSKGLVTIPKALRQQLGPGRSISTLPACCGHDRARHQCVGSLLRGGSRRGWATQRQLMESGQDLFLPKSVALELEWVPRGYRGFRVEQVCGSRSFQSLPRLSSSWREM
jgi:hypothetical protein